MNVPFQLHGSFASAMRTGFHALYNIVPAGIATAFRRPHIVAVLVLMQRSGCLYVFNLWH